MIHKSVIQRVFHGSLRSISGSSSSSSSHNIVSAMAYKDFLRVKFNDGKTADYHHIWLRHNCVSSLHPKTKEPTLNPITISDAIAPVDIKVIEDRKKLKITWNSGDVSEFDSSFLQKFIYGKSSARDISAEHHGFLDVKGKDVSGCTIQWKDIIQSKSSASSSSSSSSSSNSVLLQKLKSHGLLVCLNGPTTPEDSIKIATDVLGGKLVATHFGLIEDLRVNNTTNKNNDQLGYTNAAVDLHTDQVFIEHPPSMQMLHCIQPSECGGGKSNFADVDAIVEHMKIHHPLEFHLLSTLSVTFHRKQAEFESKVTTPILAVDSNYKLVCVRNSYFTLTPLQFPFHLTQEYYKAYKLFNNLAYSDQFCYSFAFKSGDWVLYDNHRVMHARTAFTGVNRHMRGIYLDRMDVYSHLSS